MENSPNKNSEIDEATGESDAETEELTIFGEHVEDPLINHVEADLDTIFRIKAGKVPLRRVLSTGTELSEHRCYYYILSPQILFKPSQGVMHADFEVQFGYNQYSTNTTRSYLIERFYSFTQGLSTANVNGTDSAGGWRTRITIKEQPTMYERSYGSEHTFLLSVLKFDWCTSWEFDKPAHEIKYDNINFTTNVRSNK